jgi:ribulose-bisphosphate carboxylase large chain
MSMGYIQLGYKPDRDDLICEFYVQPAHGYTVRTTSEHVASESSIGTWTDVSTMKPRIKKMAAKVFEIKGNWVKIAYPAGLFEAGNMPQIYSSIAGNVFGMKMVENLRLESIHWPRSVMKSFRGPMFGIPGVRRLLKVKERPLAGTIVKPKLGLNEHEHARVAYDAWTGGLDIVKDDENLSHMPFNRFEKRVVETLKLRDKAEHETGERKMYMPNVTAETGEMLRRARFVKDQGGEYAMVDIVTVGWSGLQTLREANQDLQLVLHAHRAGHAAFTRNPKHGISMLVVAETARLIGVDQIHIGTVVGKMEGKKQDVIDIGEEIEHRIVREHGHVLSDNWGDINPVFAVCSGGLHPGQIPKLIEFLGKDIVAQFGGGCHGHPKGTRAGASAIRQAIDACMLGMDLKESAKTNYELREALRKWSES